LATKIANIERDIEEAENSISVNPGDLQVFGPGLPSRGSVLGHAYELATMKANLARRLAEYAPKCGGGPPPVIPVRPPVIFPPGYTFPKPIRFGLPIVGVGIIFCSLFPEVCIAASPVIAF
jgi:hypothetical protein